jgi:hypothetical protein
MPQAMHHGEVTRVCNNAAFTARYIDLHSAIHVRNQSVLTCETPSTFVICLCALHSAIHVRNQSVQTCIALSTFVICLGSILRFSMFQFLPSFA